jgi:cell division septal protein FtsQ
MYADRRNDPKLIHYILYGTAFLLFFGLATLYCNYQQIFTVKKIVVHGYHELSERNIVRISGIKRGAGMFDLNIAEGIGHLIDEPYIYNAYISREFPDAVHIHVIERQPVALLELNETYALDVFGIVLPLPHSYPIDSFPLITGVDPNLAVVPGMPTYHPDIRLAINFMNYVRHFGPSVSEQCNHITWNEEKGWIIRKNRSFPPVYLGKEDLEKRIDILNAFMKKMDDEHRDIRRFKYVSLRYNGQVIVRD